MHHAYERVSAGTHTWKQSLSVALVQNTYTVRYGSSPSRAAVDNVAFAQYLFGVFACFVLLRTGHLWAAFLAHSFCNFMGLPDCSFWTGRGQLSFLTRLRGIITAVHAIGVGLFGTILAHLLDARTDIASLGLGLFRLTEPSIFGGSFLWDVATTGAQ